MDDKECMGGSANGAAELDGVYREGDRMGPGNGNDEDGLRGAGGLLRGGERPKGEPRPRGPGKGDDEDDMREPCSSDHGSRGELVVALD